MCRNAKTFIKNRCFEGPGQESGYLEICPPNPPGAPFRTSFDHHKNPYIVPLLGNENLWKSMKINESQWKSIKINKDQQKQIKSFENQ